MGHVRRQKGTGMVRWRSDGRWEGRYTDASGQKRAVYVRRAGRIGQRECERLLADRIRDVEAGLSPSGLSLAEYAARWVARHAQLSPQSRQRYADMVRLHVATREQGSIPVVRLRPEDLEDLYASGRARGMSPKSVELLHTVLRGALATGAQRGHVMRNVAALVSPPAVPKPKRQVLTVSEVGRMLSLGDRLTALWTLAYQVPIREGELLSLVWTDLDLERGRLVLAEPKKGGVPRALLLPNRSVRALRAHRARQAEERLASGGAYEEMGLIFARLDGNKLDPRRVREAFARVLTAAGLPQRRFHDLRHTGITHLLEASVPLKVVQEIAGHRSARTTIETYAHATETMQQQAIDAMNRALA